MTELGSGIESVGGLARSSTARPAQIRALTGARIVAAVWVVLFHIRGNIASEFPALNRVVGPAIAHGELGVDLFFALSGFVLTLNYGEVMGRTLSRAATVRFYWARLARVWPVFFVTLLVAGLWHGVLLATGVGDPVPVRDFSVTSFLRQSTLVVLWTEPGFDRLTWDGPAWSVSAEALAYLAFPVVVLLMYRVARAFAGRAALLMGLVAALPISIFVGAYGSAYGAWFWLLRIVCGFLAGSLACVAVSRANRTSRLVRQANFASVAIPLAVLAAAYAASLSGHPDITPIIAPVFTLFIASLAIADGPVARLLSTRAFVVGGAASYSVYMVHMLLIEPFWWAQGHLPALFAPGSWGSKLGFILLPFVIVAVGYALWRWFEEPARHRMRRMSVQHIPERPVSDEGVLAEDRDGLESTPSARPVVLDTSSGVQGQGA